MRRKGWKLAAFVTAAAVLAAGCGGSGSSSAAGAMNYAADEAAMADGDYGTASYYDSYAAEEAAEDVEYEEEAAGMDAGAKTTADEPKETEAADSDEKLVYTCDLRMQTLTYDETLANIRKEIDKVGGIIQSESETNSDNYWYYEDRDRTSGRMTIYLTVRIPSKKYKSFLASLEGQGKILSKNSHVENISRRYHNTEAVIRNLETQEARLQEMMDRAETIEDMITIEARLTEVQTQLDQNRTELSSMDTDVAYSTVNLTIEEVVRYSADPPKKETFPDRLKNALSGSWDNFKSFLETILFAIIYLAPIALVILAAVLLIRAIYRAWRKKHPKKAKAPKQPRGPKGPGPFGGRGGSMGGPVQGGPAGMSGGATGMNGGAAPGMNGTPIQYGYAQPQPDAPEAAAQETGTADKA